MAKRLGADIYENKHANKNLIQLMMNSHIINNWIKTEYFESLKGKEKNMKWQDCFLSCQA